MNNQVEFIKFTMKEKFLMIFYTVLAILSFSTLIKSCEQKRETDVPTETVKANQVQVESKHIEKAYRMQLKQLKIHSDSLEQNLIKVKQKLVDAEQKVKASNKKLAQLIDSYDSDTSLKKDKIAFDSLANYSLEITRDYQTKDSLCNDEVNILNEIIYVKDSVIAVTTDSYERLKSSFKELNVLHENLITEVEGLQKQNKRKRIMNKFWAGTTSVLTGICLTLFLKR